MRNFQEENQKTFQEYAAMRDGKIRAHYACVLKQNRVCLAMLRFDHSETRFRLYFIRLDYSILLSCA
jgi:hypothetical protein